MESGCNEIASSQYTLWSGNIKEEWPLKRTIDKVIGILRTMRLVLLTLFTMLFGCKISSGPDVLLLDSNQYAMVFDAAVAAASSDGMKPVLLDRRSGVIATDPAIAGSFIEPWKPQPSTPRQGLENTLSLQRRAARFEFTPVARKPVLGSPEESLIGPNLLSGAGKDLTTFVGPIELRVWVYVDRKYTQGMRRGTWTLRSESITKAMPAEQPWEQVPGTFWTPMNRDVARERALLATVEASMQRN